jgi:replication fork protection complex subunit Tof1/Swi1
MPEALQKHLDVIARYLEEPVDLGGSSPLEMLQKKRTKRGTTRRRRRASSSASESEASGDVGEPKKRKTKRRKEEVQYKSAEFIDDSDIGADDEEFYRREEAIRARAQVAAENGNASLMRSTGTKKRKRRVKTTESDSLAQTDLTGVGDEDGESNRFSTPV